MIKNDYGVVKRQWNKWAPNQRLLYNNLYSYMKDNPVIWKHPGMDQLPPEHWETLCHNSAYMAAELMNLVEGDEDKVRQEEMIF